MAPRRPSTVRGPRVLVLVSHPGIGSAIEALLRMERRYDVRWSQSPDATMRDWQPDLVVVEAPLAGAAPNAPRIILVGDPEKEATKPSRQRTRLLRKDAASGELIDAVDAILDLSAGGTPGSGRFAFAALSTMALVAFAGLLLKALLR